MGTDIPFDQCDTDDVTLDTSGGTIAALFTDLDRTKTKSVIIYNGGSVNILFGKTAAAATFPILPGAALNISPKDLSKVAVKAASSTCACSALAIF